MCNVANRPPGGSNAPNYLDLLTRKAFEAGARVFLLRLARRSHTSRNSKLCFFMSDLTGNVLQ